MMSLSISFDHRLVDGAPAARFLQRVKQFIEQPFPMVFMGKVNQKGRERNGFIGRCVLVTGGAHRVGKAIALTLAKMGAAQVVFTFNSLAGSC